MGGADLAVREFWSHESGIAVPGPWLGMRTLPRERLELFWDKDRGAVAFGRMYGFDGKVEIDITPELLEQMLDQTFA